MRAKDITREAISLHTASYLASGGQIQRVDHTANASYSEPIKRTRREQVEHQRHMGRYATKEWKG